MSAKGNNMEKTQINDDFATCIGRKITAIRVAPDQSGVVLETPDAPLYFALSGDCCSESWWSDIVNPSALIGATVQGVITHDIEIPDDDKRTRQECDDLTRYIITTDKGECVMEWRNSSNGYYSGWIASERELPDFSAWETVTTDRVY